MKLKFVVNGPVRMLCSVAISCNPVDPVQTEEYSTPAHTSHITTHEFHDEKSIQTSETIPQAVRRGKNSVPSTSSASVAAPPEKPKRQRKHWTLPTSSVVQQPPPGPPTAQKAASQSSSSLLDRLLGTSTAAPSERRRFRVRRAGTTGHLEELDHTSAGAGGPGSSTGLLPRHNNTTRGAAAPAPTGAARPASSRGTTRPTQQTRGGGGLSQDERALTKLVLDATEGADLVRFHPARHARAGPRMRSSPHAVAAAVLACENNSHTKRLFEERCGVLLEVERERRAAERLGGGAPGPADDRGADVAGRGRADDRGADVAGPPGGVTDPGCGGQAPAESSSPAAAFGPFVRAGVTLRRTSDPAVMLRGRPLACDGRTLNVIDEDRLTFLKRGRRALTSWRTPLQVKKRVRAGSAAAARSRSGAARASTSCTAGVGGAPSVVSKARGPRSIGGALALDSQAVEQKRPKTTQPVESSWDVFGGISNLFGGEEGETGERKKKKRGKKSGAAGDHPAGGGRTDVDIRQEAEEVTGGGGVHPAGGGRTGGQTKQRLMNLTEE